MQSRISVILLCLSCLEVQIGDWNHEHKPLLKRGAAKRGPETENKSLEPLSDRAGVIQTLFATFHGNLNLVTNYANFDTFFEQFGYLLRAFVRKASKGVHGQTSKYQKNTKNDAVDRVRVVTQSQFHGFSQKQHFCWMTDVSAQKMCAADCRFSRKMCQIHIRGNI